MATYNITSPDGQAYKITAPDGASEADVLAYAQRNAPMIKGKPEPKTSLAKDLAQGVGNLVAGGVRGAGSIGATLLRPFDTASENEARRKAMDEALQSLGAEPDSFMYQGGKIGAEIAGTAGVGGTIAKGVALAPRLGNLATSIASGGMTANGANMATRMAGGAINGAASAGLVNPDDALLGAGIGAALPPALRGMGVAGAKTRQVIGNAFLSEDAATARRIAEIAGAKTRDEVGALRNALNTPRPSNIGVNMTAPQILQNEGISQLQRSLQNVGDTSISRRVAGNQQALTDTLNRLSPITGTLQDTAQDAGNAISSFARQGEAAATKKVEALFNSVDPFGETRFLLPIDNMAQQQAKYLGKGTFGMGAKADEALNTARSIGTENLDALKATKAPKEMNLLQAVKRSGGINPKSLSSMELSGEIRDLKQSGLGRVTNAKSGKSVERLAEEMWQRGFIPDDDPATLLDALRAGGDDVAMGGGEDAYRMAMERSMGDMPAAQSIGKPVSFGEVQNLRSSIASAIDDLSSRAGRQNEIAALRGMKRDIDAAVNKVASGQGSPQEFFAQDMVDTWRQGIAAHQAKKQTFNTGPQSRLFARGGDGLPAAQGAEVPRLFFNSLRSQTDDMASFSRLANGNQPIQDELRKYAVTAASKNTDALGNLTNSKFGSWREGHSGAIGSLFNESDQAALSEIAKYLKTADSAERLGMAKGSNTAQNINAAMSSGLLENPLVGFMANRVPVLKSVAAPTLDKMKTIVKAKKAEKLGGLLADPELLSSALDDLMMLKSGSLLGLSPRWQNGLNTSIVRTAPVLAAQ